MKNFEIARNQVQETLSEMPFATMPNPFTIGVPKAHGLLLGTYASMGQTQT
jgi:hypothetical protein